MRPVTRQAHQVLCEDADAPGELSRSWCLLCADRSPETDDPETARLWCLARADQKGHTSFRAMVTRCFVAKSL